MVTWTSGLLGISGGPKVAPDVSVSQLIGYNLFLVAGILGLRVILTILRNR